MKISAITGSGQPIARRVASSSSTSRIEPITTSIVSGLPTRKAMSSKMYGMYSTEIATVFLDPDRGAERGIVGVDRHGSHRGDGTAHRADGAFFRRKIIQFAEKDVRGVVVQHGAARLPIGADPILNSLG